MKKSLFHKPKTVMENYMNWSWIYSFIYRIFTANDYCRFKNLKIVLEETRSLFLFLIQPLGLVFHFFSSWNHYQPTKWLQLAGKPI